MMSSVGMAQSNADSLRAVTLNPVVVTIIMPKWQVKFSA